MIITFRADHAVLQPVNTQIKLTFCNILFSTNRIFSNISLFAADLLGDCLYIFDAVFGSRSRGRCSLSLIVFISTSEVQNRHFSFAAIFGGKPINVEIAEVEKQWDGDILVVASGEKGYAPWRRAKEGRSD